MPGTAGIGPIFICPNDRSKKLGLYPLAAHVRPLLRAAQLPPEYRAGLVASPSGPLPVKAGQLDSLLEIFRRAPDPRDDNRRYAIGPVHTLVALALWAGRWEMAEMARFATTLTQRQRRRPGLPLKKGTRFDPVPGSGVFDPGLRRMDADAFAGLLTGWLQSRAGHLPAALALDGKLVTADPLHCQRACARSLVEKGGDSLFQIQGNQPGLLAQARKFDMLEDTPFWPKPKVTTDG